MTETVERCRVLVGQAGEDGWQVTARRLTRGERSRVEADWAWALAREEARGDVTGFLHTHPRGAGVQPSQRDRQTMQAWCSALGKPLLCLIRDGAHLAGYWFAPHQEHERAAATIRRVRPGQYFVSN